MTHTKHRKRRERADREAAEARLDTPFGREYDRLRQILAFPLSPDDPYWTTGRTGRAG